MSTPYWPGQGELLEPIVVEAAGELLVEALRVKTNYVHYRRARFHPDGADSGVCNENPVRIYAGLAS